ncbi:MAG: trypsin-like peptidase domain-containing protein [Vampirovibrionales bacterium]|nr:trypsin-like peptidase domain-containing protein [Vampirovibrionales bacterium]
MSVPYKKEPKNWVTGALWGVLLACTIGVTGAVVLDQTGAIDSVKQLWPKAAQGSTLTVSGENGVLRRPNPGMLGMNPSLIADVAETVAPSVVNIDVTKAAGPSSAQSGPFPFGEGFIERFFGLTPDELGDSPFRGYGSRSNTLMPQVIGNGSGFILDKSGHVLTNYHVVDNASDIQVTLNDGRKLPAKVVGRDKYSDLVVLKINASNLTPAVIGQSAKLRPGEWVLAVGSPLGFDHTVTLGIISAISRQVPDLNANVEFIQTDAAINPGNSGGPLVNLNGEVIGINTAIAGRGQNIGFAIPVDVARQVADSLISSGQINRPWLGLAMMDMEPPVARSLGLPETTQGAVVARVIPDSPAQRAGFMQGDVIQRIEGKPVTSAKSIQEWVRKTPINTPLNMQILRNGSLSALTVKTDQLPAEPAEG